MADELDRHTRPPVDRGLEGEHGEHQRDAPADRLDASAAPRPDLRRDEVDDRHAGAARRARQAQVELGEIDDHEDTRPASALEDGPQAPVRAVEHRHAAHRLARAGGGGRRHVDEELHPRRGHPRASHPEEPAAGSLCLQGPAERGAVEVAGRLARDQHDGRSAGAHVRHRGARCPRHSPAPRCARGRGAARVPPRQPPRRRRRRPPPRGSRGRSWACRTGSRDRARRP